MRSKDFGRDGVSGLLTPERAMRARDVSRPKSIDQDAAAVKEILARLEERHRRR